jgi:hypothetical protein
LDTVDTIRDNVEVQGSSDILEAGKQLNWDVNFDKNVAR